MKPAPFGYHRPAGLEEACAALAADPGAKVLAGGQSLLPLLSMRLAAPSALVDLSGVPGLDRVRVETDGVHVGALARQADVAADPRVGEAQPLLPLALASVAHATIRNRGTVVGSLAHADAAAELPAVLLLLGGSVTAVSVRGPRTVPASELFTGPMETTLAPDEIAVEAHFPALPPGAGVAFEEISRRNGDYAIAGVAALVETEAGAVTAARVAYVAVAETATVVDAGTDLTDLEVVADRAVGGLEVVADLHADADYRGHLARVLTARVLSAALARARGEAAA